jgi:carbon-monoxide dehydrogenase large subunit
MFSIATGSYDYGTTYMECDAVYTNKPPGGVAYRCSFRVTEAVHAIERITHRFAFEVGKDPADLRMQNFIKKEDFPWTSPTGWIYDSGDYHAGLQKAMDALNYNDLRR